MPHRDLLSPAQRGQLLALPATVRDVVELYTLTPDDCQFIARHRTKMNRIGIALQLCFLRFPGRAWTPEEVLPPSMVRYIAHQVETSSSDLSGYAERDQTRREHFAALLRKYGWKNFGLRHYRELSAWLTEQARSTDQGLVLVTLLMNETRRRKIVVPALPVLERLALSARARARRDAYRALTADLTIDQQARLEGLLDTRNDSRQTHLGWLRQATGGANPTNILSCIERLTFIRGLGIPLEWARRIHQNRLVQIAREGSSTDVAHLRVFGNERRCATLVAAALDTAILLLDETLELHERYLGKQFKKAERRHLQTFQDDAKAINDKLRLYAAIGQSLIDSRESHTDPFVAIDKLVPWEDFKVSVVDAGKLTRPAGFDYLGLVTSSYSQLRRYAPAFLEAFEFRATPATEELLKAIGLLRDLNAANIRRVPNDAPTGFIRQRWQKHIFTDDGIDRRFFETCVLSELGKALRSGDLWVTGSRRYKDFDEYLLPIELYRKMQPDSLGVAVEADCKTYLKRRSEELQTELRRTERLAKEGRLPDASIVDGVLKITPLDNQEPDEADLLNRQAYSILPRIKITDLLVEIDEWTGFTRHFTHLRTGGSTKDRELLLAAILADGINLGLARMAEACPRVSASALSRIATWHIREETYAKALAEIVNLHHRLDFAGNWGDGTTSSSDGQHFRTGGRGDAKGEVNAHYGNEAGVTFYTHVSDQYRVAPRSV